MRSYRVFGLTIHSEIELPELPLFDGPPDVCVEIGSAGVPEEAWASERRSWSTPEASWVFHASWGAIRVDGGARVTIESRGGLGEQGMRVWLLGPALAILLHQRRMLVLHGSAVNLNGTVVVFVGDSGAGKSTTAFACSRRGWPVVSDDIIPVELVEDWPMVRPGLPQLRIDSDMLRAAGETPEDYPLPLRSDDKRHVRCGLPSLEDRLPLAAIYVLGQGEAYSIQSLPRQEAFAEIARNSFLAPLMLQSASLPWHLDVCTRLALSTRLRRLVFPRTFEALENLPALVLDDLKRHEVGR